MSTIILGIESSCDDTSAAVIKDGVLLSSVIASQAVHEAYGGVVPELASRAHQQNIVPVVHEALKRAGVAKEECHCLYSRTGSDGFFAGRSVFCQRTCPLAGYSDGRGEPFAGSCAGALYSGTRR